MHHLHMSHAFLIPLLIFGGGACGLMYIIKWMVDCGDQQ